MSYTPQNTIYVKPGDDLVGIAAAAGNNTRLVLEPGTHTLAATLVLSAKTNFSVEGGSDVNLSYAGVGNAVDILGCTDTTLRGFRITAPNCARAIRGDVNANTRIRLLELTITVTGTGAAIEFIGNATSHNDILIRGCTITTNGYAILFQTNAGTLSNIRVEANCIRANAAPSGGRGIYFAGVATAITDVVIVGNLVGGFQINIECTGIRYTVTGNIVQSSASDAIRVSGTGSREMTFTGNVIDTAGAYGFSISGGVTANNVTFTGNTIRSTTLTSIFLSGVGINNIVISSNLIYDPGGVGIYNSTPECTIKGNRIYSSASYGIQLVGAVRTNVVANILTETTLEPIEMNAVTDVVVEANICDQCGGDGIEAMGNSTRVVIKNNEVNSPASQGIRLANCTDVVVSGNLLNDNDDGESIIDCASCSHVTFANNYVRLSSDYGYYISACSHILIDGGEIYDPVDSGVYITGSSYVEVRNVKIYAPGNHGVEIVSGSDLCVVSCCEINVPASDGISCAGDYCQIVGNKIFTPGSDGIEVVGGADYCLVQGNHVTAAGANGIIAGTGGTASLYLNIAGNAIYSAASDGIELVDVDESEVVGNRAQGCTGFGVVEAAACDQNLFDGNHWRGNTAGATSYNGTNRTVGTEKT